MSQLVNAGGSMKLSRVGPKSSALKDHKMPDIRKLGGEVLFEGRFLRFIKRKGWECIERANCHGIVAIVAVTAKGELILNEQYSNPLGKSRIDLPAGLVGDGKAHAREGFKKTAARELREESGYSAKKLKFIFDRSVSSGMSNEVVSYYKAEGLRKVSRKLGVEDEVIKLHLVKLTELDRWLKAQEKAGKIIDAKVEIAWRILAV